MAKCHLERSNLDIAKQYLWRAYNALSKATRTDRASLAGVRESLGTAYLQQGNYTKAVKFLADSCKTIKRVPGVNAFRPMVLITECLQLSEQWDGVFKMAVGAMDDFAADAQRFPADGGSGSGAHC